MKNTKTETTTIKSVKGNVLRLRIPLTVKIEELVDGEIVEHEEPFYPNPSYPTTVHFVRTLPKTFDGYVQDNVVSIADYGTLGVGSYNVEVRCKDEQGNPYRYMVRNKVEIVDATIDAGIEAGIEFDASVQTLEGGVFIEYKGVQSDWDETDNTQPSYIRNKPDLTVYATKEELDAVEAEIPVLPDHIVTDENYVHTDNNYTTAEKTKLASLENYDDTQVRQLIADEKATRQSADQTMQSSIASEVSRATAAEQANATAINELDYRVSNNKTAITTEKNRATAAEQALADRVSANENDIADIKVKIPTQASSQNKLADKEFVNSSIATNTADFKGTYNSLAELEQITANANDYGFVIATDAAGNTIYNRYKYIEGTGWSFEYALNNSSFTAAQWAAIQSGITAALVTKLTDLPDNTTLNERMQAAISAALASYYTKTEIDGQIALINTALSQKQDVINDLASIRSGAAAGATAYQKPNTGIPKTDLASGVQQSLDKADAAVSNVTVNGDALRVTKGGVNTDLTIPYAERAGEAKNLEGTLMKDSTFLFRPTANHTDVASGDAQIEGIKGNTVKFNQLVQNGNFASSGSWAVEGGGAAELSISSNKLTISANRNYYVQCLNSTINNYITGHKYLLSAFVYSTTGNAFIALGNLMSKGSVSTSQATTEIRLSGIVTCSESFASIPTYRVAVSTPGTYENITGTIRNFTIIDLTAIFGAGNEPATVAEFEAWLAQNVGLKDYYDYTAGELVPVKMTGIKTVGFNQWDEEWEVGTINENGSASDVPYAIRSKYSKPTKVISGTVYYIKASQSKKARIYFYNADDIFIARSQTLLANETFVTPSDCAYIRFALTMDYGTTYNHDICINLSHSGNRNGEYEPYWTETKDVPVTTMTGKLNGQGSSVVVFPDGLKQAGSVRDEIVGNKAIKRVGSVDMGSLSWGGSTQTGYENSFRCATAPSDMAKTIDPASICSIYENTHTGAGAWISNSVGDKKYSTGYYNNVYAISVRDSSYTDATTFKTAMSGVMLYYELATPEEYILDDFELPKYYKVDDYGTEEILPENGSELTTCAPTLDIKYGLNATDSMRNIYDNFVCASESQEFSDNKKAMARQNIGAIGLADIAGKEDKVEIVSVESGTTAITAAVGKYYSVAGSVGTLAITLPAVSDTSHLQSIVISLTAGAAPNVSFVSADSAAISYFRGYEILANTSYEINCLFNGTKWIIGYAIID